MPNGHLDTDIDPELFVDQCSRTQLAAHPRLDGRTNDPQQSGVKGLHCSEGVAVSGLSLGDTGVLGDGERRGVVGQTEKGTGVFGSSRSGEGIRGETRSTRFAAVVGNALSPTRAADGFPTGVWGTSRAGEGVHGETHSDTFAAVAGIQLNPASTGAGVYGEHRGDGPAGFFAGNVVVTKDIFLSNADCAEEFDVDASKRVEPGTVMVIDHDGVLQPSHQPYDKRVAGIVSGAGPYRPAIVLDRQQPSPARIPIALLGKVYCKADANFGAIELGDLLTTSSNPGHAMRADDPRLAFGAVIGKALRALPDGVGLIPVLVALQ